MKNRRRIIGVLAAAILSIAGTAALVGYVQSAKDDAVADEELVEVFVVERPVPKGADVDEIVRATTTQRIPARLVQEGAIRDLAEIGSMQAAFDLLPGDQLVMARLAAPDAVQPGTIDKVQVSAKLAAERAVGGALKSGDVVGVYLSFAPFDLAEAGAASAEPGTTDTTAAVAGARSPSMTRMEFQQVLVTNVQLATSPLAEEDGEEQPVAQVGATDYVVTLALTAEQSEQFVFAAEFGRVWLSLQSAGAPAAPARLVTLDQAYEAVG